MVPADSIICFGCQLHSVCVCVCVCVLVCVHVCLFFKCLLLASSLLVGMGGGGRAWEWCGVGGVGGGPVSPIRDVRGGEEGDRSRGWAHGWMVSGPVGPLVALGSRRIQGGQ